MNVIDYILMVIGLLAPALWELIKAKNPDLPIDQETFVNVIVYVFSAIFGVKAMKQYIVKKLTKRNKTYKEVLGD